MNECLLLTYTYVTLEHKSSLKQHGYICRNIQQYIVGHNYRLFFYAKNH